MRITRLPRDAHVARICKKSTLDDNKQPGPGSFEYHPGNDTREPDRALSVHWLEYLLVGSDISTQLVVLREYLIKNSPFEKELKPTREGKIAVIKVSVLDGTEAPGGVCFDCHHDPRDDNAICCCDGSGLHGKNGPITASEALIDPHSLLISLPEDGPLAFAVRDHLSRLVCLVEPGII